MSAITAKASRKMKKYAVLTREPRCFLGSFDFSWEQRKVREVTDRYDNLRIPVAANLRVAGTTPYYGANGIQDYVEGYTHDGEFILVAEDGANDLKNYPVKCVKGRIWVNNHAHVLQGKCAYADNQFLAYAISQADIESLLVGGGRAKLNAETLMDIELLLPIKDEQIQIGHYLARLDHLITLHQRKCVFLFGFFQAFISMIFTASTFSWEQRKLGELVDRVVRKNINNESTLPLTISAQYGLVDQITYFNNRVASRDVSNYYLVLNGEFAYNKSTSDGYPFGAVKRLDLYEKGVLSTLYIVFAPKKEQQIDSDYLTVFFDTDRWHKGVAERAAEGARNHGLLNISAEDFFDIDLSVPKDIVEQKQIGAFIRQLDNLITLHQRECISFTTRAGRLILTANKKRNTSSWEQRKVSDLAEKTYGGGTPTTSNEAYWNGDIPWIQSSDVVDGKLLGVEPRKWITQDGLNNSAAQLIPGNSIAIITRVGVGKLAFMPYSYATSQDFLSLSKLNAEPLFTVYACYKKLQSELNAVQGTSIKGITKDELLAKDIMVPRYAEQQQIGAFFKQLDNLITLHQRKPFLMKWRTSDANRNQTNRLVL